MLRDELDQLDNDSDLRVQSKVYRFLNQFNSLFTSVIIYSPYNIVITSCISFAAIITLGLLLFRRKKGIIRRKQPKEIDSTRYY